MRFCILSDRNNWLSQDNSPEYADIRGIVGA